MPGYEGQGARQTDRGHGRKEAGHKQDHAAHPLRQVGSRQRRECCLIAPNTVAPTCHPL